MHGVPIGEDRMDVIRYIVGQCGSTGLAEALLDLAIRREAINAPHDEE